MLVAPPPPPPPPPPLPPPKSSSREIVGEAVVGFWVLLAGRFSKNKFVLLAFTKALPPRGGGFSVALNPAEFGGR